MNGESNRNDGLEDRTSVVSATAVVALPAFSEKSSRSFTISRYQSQKLPQKN